MGSFAQDGKFDLSQGKNQYLASGASLTFGKAQAFQQGDDGKIVADGNYNQGSVTLSDGLKELVIRVTQEDGFFTVGSPEIAPSFDLYEELVDKRVTIPYQKSKPGYKADVTATLEGAGAEGIAIESLSGYEMEAGDGAIPLALSGTPTKKGPITVKLHV